MNSVCHPLPPPVAQEMLQVLAQSLCARPGDRPAVRESRTRQMVHSVLGFEPRDGLEYMLSGLVFGHFHLILDAMSDAFRGEMDTIKAKTRTSVVSLDRSMLGLVKELRITRHRPISAAAMAMWEQAQQAAAAPDADRMDWVAEWAGMPPTEEAPEESAAATEPLAEPTPSAAAPATTPNTPAKPTTGAARQPETAKPGVAARPAPTIQHRQTPAPYDADDATTEQHIAAFQEAMAATAETLAEARALDRDKVDPKAASGG